jgi:hypothetical protein
MKQVVARVPKKKNPPKPQGDVQGPALYGTADEVGTPVYAEREKSAKAAEAAGAKAANDALAQQKAMLAAIKASGGSSADAKAMAALKKNADAIRKAISSGSYGQQYDDLITQLGGMTDTARTQINEGYGSLATMLGQQTNPYADLRFQAVQTNPALAQFMQSQGGSMDQLNTRVSAENTANQAATTQFQNIADLLGARQVSGNTQRTADVEAARLAALADLQSQSGAYNFAVNQQKQAERNRLNQILLELAAKGVNVGGIY